MVGEGKTMSSENEVFSPKAGEGLGQPGSLSHSPPVTGKHFLVALCFVDTPPIIL